MNEPSEHAYELYQLTQRLQNSVKNDNPIRCRDVIIELQDYLRDNSVGHEEIQDEIVVELNETRDEIGSWDGDSIPTVAQNRIDRCILRINALSLRSEIDTQDSSLDQDEVRDKLEALVEQSDEYDSDAISNLGNKRRQEPMESESEYSTSAAMAILTEYLENSANWQRSKALSLQKKTDEIEETLDRIDEIDTVSEEHKARIDRMRDKVDNEYTFDFDEPSERNVDLIVKIGVKQYLNQKQKEISPQEEFFIQLDEKVEKMLKKAKANAQKDKRDTVFPRDLAADNE